MFTYVILIVMVMFRFCFLFYSNFNIAHLFYWDLENRPVRFLGVVPQLWRISPLAFVLALALALARDRALALVLVLFLLLFICS